MLKWEDTQHRNQTTAVENPSSLADLLATKISVLISKLGVIKLSSQGYHEDYICFRQSVQSSAWTWSISFCGGIRTPLLYDCRYCPSYKMTENPMCRITPNWSSSTDPLLSQGPAHISFWAVVAKGQEKYRVILAAGL